LLNNNYSTHLKFFDKHYLDLILLIITITLSGLLLCSTVCHGQPRHIFKIATLAPEGSVWMRTLHNFIDEVKEKSNGTIGFKVYPGGVMGDDQAMYRKMRVGQLHGGGFTMTGIARVVSDFRVMALPFFFNSYDEVDVVKKGLLPIFKEQFSEKKLELLAMTEVGFVYSMGTTVLATIDDLKNGKCWSPTGDPVTSTFLSSIGINPIQLSIPNVLSSLQTGLVNVVFNSLYGSIVLQWFTKVKYIADTPYGYAYGVFLLDKRSFSKLDQHNQKLVQETADKHFSILLDKTRQSNMTSRKTLTEHGVQFIPIEEKIVNQFYKYRDQTVQQLTGKSFSLSIYQKAMHLLTTYRNKKNKITLKE